MKELRASSKNLLICEFYISKVLTKSWLGENLQTLILRTLRYLVNILSYQFSFRDFHVDLGIFFTNSMVCWKVKSEI